jgi:hypothetical protein
LVNTANCSMTTTPSEVVAFLPAPTVQQTDPDNHAIAGYDGSISLCQK